MKAFIVEDAQPVRERIKSTIEEIGGEVVGEATTERDAVNGLIALGPDLAIIDLSLAQGSGLEVLRQVKKVLPMIVLVVLTDHSQEDYQKICFAAGADFFVEKATEYTRFIALMELLQSSMQKLQKDIHSETE